jgi:hypothetical protein
LRIYCDIVVNMYALAGVTFIFFYGVVAQRGHGPRIPDDSRSHTKTHYIQWYSSRRVVSSSQRPLPHKTQQSQEINIHATGRIRTHNPSKEEAAAPRLRPRGHWGRHIAHLRQDNSKFGIFELLVYKKLMKMQY